MKTVTKIRDLRAIVRQQREQGHSIGFVPTMGNLHQGHLQLVKRAQEVADFIVVSIFVNPMQFGQSEDLDGYPRTLEQDQKKLVNAGSHLLFAPPVTEIYPAPLETQTYVEVPGLSQGYCGDSRPGHFRGVATVVSMLFNMVQPDFAIFGEKDFQQLAVIRKMVRDLFMPIEVIGVPTVREASGLALSSRNGYLEAEERERAPQLHAIMQAAAKAVQNGTDCRSAERDAEQAISAAGLTPDYFHLVNSHTLQPADQGDTQVTILAAAYLGKTRLIDNLSLTRAAS